MEPGKELATYRPAGGLNRRESEILTFEGVRIGFRNFEGRAGQYNREGERSFCLFVDERMGEELRLKHGLNPKPLKPRPGDDEVTSILRVKVNFRGQSNDPQLWLLTSRGRTRLGAEEADIFDHIVPGNAEFTASAYRSNVNGKDYTTLYLRTMYLTMLEDYLERKYADVPEIGSSTLPAIEPGPQEPPLDDTVSTHYDLEGEVVDTPF